MSVSEENQVVSLTECESKLNMLFEKYESDPYMLNRIKTHIINILPSTLDNEYKNHEKRIVRNNFLTNEQQIFIQVFLSKNKYYYLSSNNCFYQYDGKHYSVIKEDDIHHKLLSTISKDRTLMEWKYKTKINIIKQIKERNLFRSTPETDTIQKVIRSLYPSLLSTRSQVKYLLTIIGDTILKKNNDIIVLIKPKTKKYLAELEIASYTSLGINNITNNFMTKFHENYSYENCRLLKMNDTMLLEDWNKTLMTIGLDILCVATYYSSRYGNSDIYLTNHADEELKNYTLFVKTSTQNEIMENFCKHSISELPIVAITDDIVSGTKINWNGTKINWKNMHFIWKRYISTFSLPNMIYSQTLKSLLINKYVYEAETDAFQNITSKYLPNVRDFIEFWNQTITEDNIQDQDFDNEFEIDELCVLFKSWTQQNSAACLSNGNINEIDVLKIINHFFQNVEIIENKYVLNISCSLWHKLTDINNVIDVFKNEPHDTNCLVHFDDIYDYYRDYCKKMNIRYIVSKRYFEKYLYISLSSYILFDKFISNDFFASC